MFGVDVILLSLVLSHRQGRDFRYVGMYERRGGYVIGKNLHFPSWVHMYIATARVDDAHPVIMSRVVGEIRRSRCKLSEVPRSRDQGKAVVVASGIY